MCGILVINDKKGALNDDHFTNLLGEITHRGPDEQNFVKNGSLYLGHVRLSIIDVANGHQPFKKNDKVLLFNGEIYNYKSIKKELQDNGIIFETDSDTEVVLEAFKYFGDTFIEKLDGMYAFVIYDQKNNELTISRDFFGIKPLYMYEDNNFMVLSSEMHPINKVIKDLKYSNLIKLNDYLLNDSCDSLYVGQDIIRRGFLYKYDVKNGMLRIAKYKEEKEKSLNKYYYDNDLLNLLEEEIDQQLIADEGIGVGIFLSGGIDSSIITAIASKIRPKINTYSIVFDDDVTEEYYSRIVAKKFSTNHTEYKFNEDTLIEYIPTMINAMDLPIYDPAILPFMYLCDKVSKNNKVALSGDGGDELFSGYTTLRINKYKKLFRLISKLSNHLGTISNKFKNINSIIDNNLSSNRFEDIYKNDFDVLDERLLRKTDISSMHYGLEVRVPFLSKRIYNYASDFHPESFINLKYGKMPLRRIAKKLIGNDIAFKKKQGFRIPIKKWVTQSELSDVIEEDLHDLVVPKMLISNEKVKKMLKRKNIYFSEIFKLYILNLWIKKHFK
ncbi:asparagine synthase (glutamine-hydrolyzing) [Gracilimonas amylolytica]|uniref:asparagine synthase (glutamine-hydrolyzing) n=1 Tax=Gracilimonas amylolytica TaxID=1749045 RepID=UPI000CD9E2DE|nr:asparagine synthase (glutamine-hydrolyzing) [Gracilimonas amylolytica]